MDLPSFLIGLVVAWIIALLVYWLGARRQEEEEALTGASVVSLSDHLSRVAEVEAREEQLQAELAAAQARCDEDRTAAQAEIERLNAQVTAIQTPEPAQMALAGAPQMLEAPAIAEAPAVVQMLEQPEAPVMPEDVAPLPTPAEPDDLKRIEGIGPKIEALLNDAGIVTFAQLADAGAQRVREVLEGAGERFRLADPGTWAQQARLAADGRWQELADLQDSLRGGR